MCDTNYYCYLTRMSAIFILITTLQWNRCCCCCCRKNSDRSQRETIGNAGFCLAKRSLCLRLHSFIRSPVNIQFHSFSNLTKLPRCVCVRVCVCSYVRPWVDVCVRVCACVCDVMCIPVYKYIYDYFDLC